MENILKFEKDLFLKFKYMSNNETGFIPLINFIIKINYNN
jgi:hypothetical protein